MVTGADGFIGSHLTQQLIREGYDVTAFCLYNSFGQWGWLDTLSKEEKASMNVVLGDVRDPNGVRVAMKGQDTVFHLAALIAIPLATIHLIHTLTQTLKAHSTFCRQHATLTHAVFL